MAVISISDLWKTWNIRGFIIFSLLLQVFLILFASLRKKIANDRVIFLLWLAYLMADWVAAYAIGLISHNQGNSSAHGVEVNGAIHALWASFLLLHLGGTDTITAFSLEDSSLWRRHLLNLIFQVGAAIYVFMQIFPGDKSLVIPTMLVFFVGIIKNSERILALYLSSLPRIRESMNPYHFEGKWHLLHEAINEYEYSDGEEVKLAESIVVKYAYNFFHIIKVFLADLIFPEDQRNVSLQFFNKVSPLDALRIISVELQFMYEVLHTKALVMRSQWGYIFRFTTLNVLVVCLIQFNHLKKHQLLEVDIKITYSLLFGGITLDVMALLMLVFSDWTVAEIMCHDTTSSKLNSSLHKLVSATDYLRGAKFAKCEVEWASNTFEILDTCFIFRRWSESIPACNLFSELWKESPRKMNKCNRGRCIIASSNICSFPFRMAKKITSCFHQACEKIAEGCYLTKRSMFVHTKYVFKYPFIKELWIFIFKEVRRKCQENNSIESIFEARGNLFLGSKLKGTDHVNLLDYVTKENFDISILRWHIATELWFDIEKTNGEINEEREFSKILSDYMLYLVFNQPNVMFDVVGNAPITSMQLWEIMDAETWGLIVMKEKWMLEFRREKLTFPPSQLGGRSSLAKLLEKLGENKWEVISGVWVEMLTYAAAHIRGEAHAQVLSKGGELLAFVWLLMTHFGCFYKLPWGQHFPKYGQF